MCGRRGDGHDDRVLGMALDVGGREGDPLFRHISGRRVEQGLKNRAGAAQPSIALSIARMQEEFHHGWNGS